MKKLLVLLLLIAASFGIAFADESSDEYDDFDDIFMQATEDVEVEQSEPVVSQASSGRSSSMSVTGHFKGDVGLTAIIQDDTDFGGYIDLKNMLYLNVKPSPVFGLHGALETSLSNNFGLGVSYLYFDYMPFDKLFISAGKKNISWGYMRLFTNCNVMSDTNGKLNAEFRIPWSTGTATFVGCYDYTKASTSPNYKDITYAFSIEQTIGHTSVNLFGKKYGQNEKVKGVHKSPLAGIEAKRTFFGYDAYAQAVARLSNYKEFTSKDGYESVTATGGFYKLWDSFTPNLGINIEYQYAWVPGAENTDNPVHNHKIFLQGGIKKIGKKKNMKGAVEWKHNFNSKDGSVTAAFIIDSLFPYASWKNGVQVDYTSASKPKVTLGTTISISLDY